MQIDPEEYELSALVERLPPVAGCRVIEVGCGDGRVTRRYSERVGSVLAIDNDRSAIARFRAGGVAANVEIRAAGMDELDLPAGSVHVVLLSWAL